MQGSSSTDLQIALHPGVTTEHRLRCNVPPLLTTENHPGRYNQLGDMVDEPEVFEPQISVSQAESRQWALPLLPSFLADPTIKPIMPENLQRYSNRPKIGQDSIMAGLTVEMWHYDQVKSITPAGWKLIVHHEGGRYFFNAEKRVYTDADLHNRVVHQKVVQDLYTIGNFLEKNDISLPESCQLILDLVFRGDTIETRYYYVNHQNRSIFFLDTFVVEPWIDTPGRLGHEIEGQYWYHLNIYPDSLRLSLSTVRELKDMTIHLIGDKTTASNGSNAPYSIEDLQRILQTIVTIEKSIRNHDSVGAMSFVSRIMYIYSRSRFWDYAGDPHARIERGQSVYSTPPTKHHRKVKKIIFIILFGIPKPYLKSIEKLWVDQMVFHLDWIELLKSRVVEWNNYVLVAAIMLNVNIGFLAIQTTIPGNDTHQRAAAYILSSLSFLANCSSLVSGLYLVRQTPREPSAHKLHAYLSHHETRWLGIDSLAILHSLPYAFLIWGFALLLPAFFVFSFRLSGLISTVTLAGFSLALIALALWVRSDWEERSTSEVETGETKPHASVSTTSEINFSRVSRLLRARRSSYDSQHTAV